MQVISVLILPVGVLAGGKTVTPAQAIPVIYMLAQHDNLSARYGLTLIERGQKSVSRRAA
jgi:hypothetical protein